MNYVIYNRICKCSLLSIFGVSKTYRVSIIRMHWRTCSVTPLYEVAVAHYLNSFKFQLVRHDIFYNGQNQEDSTECLLMLINIIQKGSMPNSSSTTPTGSSLSDILFSFVLEKYIVCDVCGLRCPSFESSSVLYISPTDTSSMQNLILEGLQQKLQKSCSRCNKNTRHIE